MSYLPKVYICSSLRPEVYERVSSLLKRLPKAIHLRPTQDQPGNKLNHVEVDVAMMHHADEIWLVGEFGRDCSWELGYATGKGIPIVFWRDETNSKHLDQDWMFNHALTKGKAEVRDITGMLDEEHEYSIGERA